MRGFQGLILLALCGIMAYNSWQCGEGKINAYTTDTLTFLNHSEMVSYVGVNGCLPCHQDKVNSFLRTGMGQSFDIASREKSSAFFGKKYTVYDPVLNLWYYPNWIGDTLMITEFRLSGNDTIYLQNRPIKYIIGSGHHTNSHLWEVNGYIYQAPLTFYTQQKKWDLPPGFENGQNTRFDRLIGHECMSCHNSLPGMVKESINKYSQVPHGISCERCHGPGSLHVEEKKSGKFSPVKAGQKDPTIVHPGKLSSELQADICQRCHLQGNAVLHSGKSWDSFRPGMKLNSVMDIYMPRYGSNRDKFIMASHAQRLRMSECWQKSSGKLTCISCHNPHVSVKETGKEIFNNACLKCHQSQSCKEKSARKGKEKNGCWGCHMPKNGPTDIPHVTVTDHMIRRKPGLNLMGNEIFQGIEAINNDHPGDRSLSHAWLNAFEQFQNRNFTLDSAEIYIQKLKGNEYREAKIRLEFLRNNYQEVVKWAGKPESEKDAITAGRIGNAMLNLKLFAPAYLWMQKAAILAPDNLDILFKWAIAQVKNKYIDDGKKTFDLIIQKNPFYALAWFNAGIILREQQKNKEALHYFQQCLKLNPDHSGALVNAGDLLIQLGQSSQGIILLQQYLKQHPEDLRIRKFLQSM